MISISNLTAMALGISICSILPFFSVRYSPASSNGTANASSATKTIQPTCGICSLKVTDTSSGLSVDNDCTSNDQCSADEPCEKAEWEIATPSYYKAVACNCGGLGGSLPSCQECWVVVKKYTETGPWTDIKCIAAYNCSQCCVIAGPYLHTVPCLCSPVPCPN